MLFNLFHIILVSYCIQNSDMIVYECNEGSLFSLLYISIGVRSCVEMPNKKNKKIVIMIVTIIVVLFLIVLGIIFFIVKNSNNTKSMSSIISPFLSFVKKAM